MQLIASISAALKEKETAGAGAHENAKLAVLQDICAEIRAFREVYMAVVRILIIYRTLDLS